MMVVDASVAVKWLVAEGSSDSARALLSNGQELVAPALIRVEVASALTRKVRKRELAAPEAEEAVDLWFDTLGAGVIGLYPDDRDVPAAVRLSLTLAHAVPDCLYLALGDRLQAPLITADGGLAAKALASFDVQVLS